MTSWSQQLMLGQHMIGIFDLGGLVGQSNITVVGWRGEEGEEKLMNILVSGLDDR